MTPIITGGLGGTSDNTTNISSKVYAAQIYDYDGAHDIRNYFDAFTMHPYTNLSGNMDGEMYWAMQVRQLMNQRGDSAKPMWGTETGASTSTVGTWNLTEDKQAALVSQIFDYWNQNITPRGPLFWYTLMDHKDISAGNEAFFGVIRTDGTHKPAFSKLQKIPTKRRYPGYAL